MLNPLPILEKLDTMTDEQKTQLFIKVFHGPEADLVLVDLMDRFFEFKPTVNDMEAGSRAVIVYIKNRLLGIYEPEQTSTGEE